MKERGRSERERKDRNERIEGRAVVVGEEGWKTPPSTRRGERALIGVRVIRDGKILIVPKDREQGGKIRECLGKIEKVEVRERKVTEPMLIVSGVERGMADEELLGKLIRGTDILGDRKVEDFKIVKRVTCRNPWKENVVLRVGLELFKLLVKRGKVEIDCERHFVEEYLGLAMCYRCCRFGHVMKFCKEKDVCHKCAGGHDGRDCNKSERKCVNCWRMFGVAAGHSARDTDCSAMLKILERSRQNIGYNARTVKISKLLFFQEPYQNFSGALGFDCYRMNGQSKVVTLVRQGLGKVWMRRECLSENVVVVELEKGGNERNVLLVNVYDEPPDARNTNSRFRDASGWLRNRRERVLVAGDFNGKNVAWGGVVTDERGEEIHDWVVMNAWNVVNGPADPPSFCSNRGESWVDLVLTKDVRVNDWSVDENEESLSDHRYVSYSMEVGRMERGARRWRYEVKGVDWERFERSMNEEWMGREPELRHLDAEESGALLQGVVEQVCRGVLRKRARVRRDERDWWNDELERERRDTRRARKRFQDARGNEREVFRMEYLEKRNGYKRKIKEAKLKEMEEELERMGDRVWDVCKRWVKGGKREVKGNLRRPDGTYTGSLEETYEELVGQYFPQDIAAGEGEGHGEMRREYGEDRVDEGEDFVVTMNELRGVIDGMSVGKAPGMDGIPNECMRHVLNGVGDSWRVIVEGCLREGVFPRVWKRAEVVWIPKKGGVMEGWFGRMDVEARQRGVHVQAYADDQVVVLSGRSVRALENEWRRVWNDCKEWARENKLGYNVAKTEAMFVPARGEIREPVIDMDGERMRMGSSVKYLGDLGSKFFALGRRKWGGSKRVLKTIYERVVCPMVLYGAEVWGERARDSRVCKQLRAIERPYLRAITKAYRTAPTAALSVLVGCVPLGVQARAKYESRLNGDMQVRRVNEGERPHPAMRGYVPVVDGEEERVVVWTDAAMNGEGRKVWGAGKHGVRRHGCVEGGYGRGWKEGGDVRVVLVITDSEQVFKQIGKFHNTWWVINKIQGEISGGLERGIKIGVKWSSRANDGIRAVDRECRRLLRGGEGEIGERMEGVSKGYVRKWRREWEMNEWQRLWDGGVTGRWLYEMWMRVNVNGCDTSWELTQVVTGHGDFKAYLRRFGLNEDGVDVMCECGLEREDARHAVLRCSLARRVRARDLLSDVLGHYPPRLGEVGRERWSDVLEWARELVGEG
ncbi:hypothetical protein NQ314_011542 [Rhamnusium bicolor]|uniref:Endonuclease/exonuclease/phosphatase domain-containing protein n=1 Tax=Rhamnusium bicolor TaxID=1586634 RepID=A0AAV8XH56_9CUCU|nr:hypothetical protein NQ314_011542 [Rhamnusium bicolor]